MPTIIVINPATASPGNSVTIVGSGFTGATAVKFGATNATFTVVADAVITATVPPGTGSVLVTVVGPSGTSNAVAFTYAGTTSGTIAALAPTSGPATGGNIVQIVGTGFTGATAVKFGTTNAPSFTLVSSTLINAVAPPGTPGTVLVTVVTPSGTTSGAAYTYTVVPAATTTTLTDVPDPSVVGQSVTFTATVAPVPPAVGVPTGTVNFNFGDGSFSGPVPLVGGVATTTHTYTTTTGSPFALTATYSGGPGFAGSVGTGSHTVGQAATTTTLADVPDPSVVGQSVAFTATVAPVAPGAGTPTGSVVFNFGDGSFSGPIALVGGVATINHTYTTTTGSPFALTATYSGSSNFSGSGGAGTHTVGVAATTTTLADVPDPSVVGQSVTFTATVAPVAPGAGTPTGTVVFNFGDGNVSGPIALVGGVASTTHTYTTTTGSPFALTATYSGSSNFTGSAGAGTHTVGVAATTTTLADVPDPSVVGQSVTFTATVAPVAPGAGTPTGTVVFNFGDGNVSGPIALVGGVASTTHTYTTTTGSPFALTATYSGDSNFSGSAGAGTHTVGTASTTTTLTDVPDPSVVGQSVTFTATVAPVAPGAGTPTGTVVFNFGDGNISAPVALVAGVATTTHAYTTTTGSPFTLTATYSGSSNFSGSAGGGTHTVNQASTTTTLTDVPDPSVVGQSVTFTATVAPVAPGAGTPTGSVVFDFGDGNVSGPIALVGGVATTTHAYTTTTGSPFALTATYSGSSNFSGSAGGGTHTVNQASTTTTLADVPDPSVVGQSVTFTATVAPVAPGAGTPTGTVVFDFGDGNVSGPIALVGGVASTTHTYTTTTGSPFTLTATYGGDSNFSGSAGGGTHTVNQASTTTTLTDVPDPSVVGQSVTFTATVAPVAPGAGTPTGTVVFNFGDGKSPGRSLWSVGWLRPPTRTRPRLVRRSRSLRPTAVTATSLVLPVAAVTPWVRRLRRRR